ncbi:hypothetical protein [Methylorubrum aminovorans]|nr:hypothetical protein [Methylorubrum aminovorans]
MIGANGLYPADYVPQDYQSLQNIHWLSTINTEKEVAFVCGHLNGWKDKSLKILHEMKMLTTLESIAPLQQLNLIKSFWKNWGISDFLNRKLVYYMNLAEVDKEIVSEYHAFTKILRLEDAPEPYFSAMELMSERYPYFQSIRTWVSILAKYKTNDFRQHNALHNALPVPLSTRDIASFLRKSHSMSLTDELCAIKIVISLADEWPEIVHLIESLLDADLLAEIQRLESSDYSHTQLTDGFPDEDPAFLIYRRALAFLEQSSLVKHRFAIDVNIGWRLLPSRYGLLPVKRLKPDQRHALRSNLLTEEPVGFDVQMWPEDGRIRLFTRTIIFLNFIAEYPAHASFNEDEIRFIFENTTSLQFLMTESELDRIYSIATDEGKIIISTLALAIYKQKEHDDDIDFKFRYTLQETILADFNGSVIEFIQWLSNKTPNIAKFLVNTLDRQTIQKLYMIVESAEQADSIRQDMLRHLGEQLYSLEYLIEADRIWAHNQVSKLKTEIDDSRVYVDSNAIKKWIRENPNAYLKEYRRLVEHSIESLTRAAIIISDSSISVVHAEVSVIASFDYILAKATETVFVQFCTNHLFGIDSYLGRRIRHNTLHGMMLNGVDSLVDSYPALYSDAAYMEIHSVWLASYKKTIDRLRLDLLQFHSDTKKYGLFKSSFDLKSQSALNGIVELRKSIAFSGILDNFEDAILKFCWDQFEPQLKQVQRFISNDVRSAEIAKIDGILGSDGSPEARKFVAALRESVHDRFVTLASWFQVPEDRTFSASVRQISDLITLECEQSLGRSLQPVDWTGEHIELTIKGSSVHRLYDCLYVLIHNAYKYGKKSSRVRADLSQLSDLLNVQLSITITSDFASSSDREVQIKRISELVDYSTNISSAMVKEGYSGIRKLLYLTSSGQLQHTVAYRHDEATLSIGFKTVVEIEDVQTENSTC